MRRSQIQHFLKADPNYGRGAAEGLGLMTEDVLNGDLAAVGD